MTDINAGLNRLGRRHQRRNELGIKQLTHGHSAGNAGEQRVITIGQPNLIAPERCGRHANRAVLADLGQLGQKGAVHALRLGVNQVRFVNDYGLDVT